MVIWGSPGTMVPWNPAKNPSWWWERKQYLGWLKPSDLVSWTLSASSFSHAYSMISRDDDGWNFYKVYDDLVNELTASALFPEPALSLGVYNLGLIVYGTGKLIGFVVQESTPDWLQHPIAAFSASPLAGDGPLEVQFTDESLWSPKKWHWDFGDGETSTLQHPIHVYFATGVYRVMLTVSNEAGSDTLTKFAYITVVHGMSVYTPTWFLKIGPL